MVPPGHAVAHRTHEEDYPLLASASRADPQLLPGSKVISRGVVERLNNKAKVTMRKSYGSGTFALSKRPSINSLGKLPEPECTHDFF
jgi:hypothetical protein